MIYSPLMSRDLRKKLKLYSISYTMIKMREVIFKRLAGMRTWSINMEWHQTGKVW